MAKEALIKLRCSQALKDRLTALAKANEQSLSDFVRTKLLEYLPELRRPGFDVAKEPELPDHDVDLPA